MKDSTDFYRSSAEERVVPFERVEHVKVEIELSDSAGCNQCLWGWVPEGSFASQADFSCSKVGCAHPAQRGFCCYQDRQSHCPHYSCAKHDSIS